MRVRFPLIRITKTAGGNLSESQKMSTNFSRNSAVGIRLAKSASYGLVAEMLAHAKGK